MSNRMTALLTLALVGVLPATAEAAPPTKARQSFVLYDGVAVIGFLNFLPSPPIDTSALLQERRRVTAAEPERRC